MFRVHELSDGKFRDISPLQGFQNEATALTVARLGCLNKLMIVVQGSDVVETIDGREVAEPTICDICEQFLD